VAEKKVEVFGVSLRPKLIALLAVLAVLLWASVESVFVVDQTEDAVVLRFGQYNRTEGPGMKFKIPFIEQNYNVATKIVQKMDFGFREARQGGDLFSANQSRSGNYKDESTMLTGDLNIIDITWIIQYRITDPRAWLFNLDSKEKTIRDISQSMVSQLVGDRAILAVLGADRQAIEAEATQMINERFAAYDIGVLVTGTQLKDIFPPEGSVKAAFDDVNVAYQDMNKLINEGRETYNKKIPQVTGEAQQALQVAEGYATERVNRAIGDVARFKDVLTEYHRNPQVTRERLYLEMMQSVFQSSSGTDLIDKRLTNILPLKNLTAPQAPAAAPTTGAQ